MDRLAVFADARNHHLRVDALFVGHLHQSNDDAFDNFAGLERRAEHQYVKRIAVIRHRLRNDAIVDGIAADLFRNHPIDGRRVLRHVEFEFLPATTWDFDVGVQKLSREWWRITPDVLLVRSRGFQTSGEFGGSLRRQSAWRRPELDNRDR